YAHERGIIHRDIKPANVMVGYDGVVKVADFGLAKMTSVEGQSGLTQSGTAMGTLYYMAPESLMLGTSVDHRADIYAVGVMLYQMLTGKVPHGLFELPSLQIPGLDPRYDSIISKAMREDRELRYQSAIEMRQALDAILTQPVARVEAEATRAPAARPATARPQPGSKQQPYRPPSPAISAPSPPSSRSSVLVWVALLVLVVFGGIAWLVFAPPGGSGSALKMADEKTSTEDVNPGIQAALAKQAAPFVNSLGMKFVPVPGTEVMFCIHEVRYKDYAAYAAENSHIRNSWKNQTLADFAITERAEEHPVVNVSWEDAQMFCVWLSQKEGKTYRLPKDWEWSTAVGIGRDEEWKIVFPWGDQWPPPKGSGNFGDESRKTKAPIASAQYLGNYDDGFPTTAPVMSFKPSKLGLYDMEGNVREWVGDSEDKERVLRGGCWYYGARTFLLSSHRFHYPPGTRTPYGGFRVVLVSVFAPVGPPVGPPRTSTAKVPQTTPPVITPTATLALKDGITNTLGMKFVPVPGTGVLFCIHETRYKDYAAYAAENPGTDGSWKNQTHDGFAIAERNEDHPVVYVSWEDAQKFCAWLSQKEDKTYRLPTDEEWSIAVDFGRVAKRPKGTTLAMLSGTENTDFLWGGDFPPKTSDKAGNFSDESRKAKAPRFYTQYLEDYNDTFPTTAPVMSFKPNRFGIYDMGGNVWEWCDDWYDTAQKFRVLRGGGWDNFDRGVLRSSYRAPCIPVGRDYGKGFRLVLEVP
ncbi:MAG: bifunctional serine/threonine-protein kinase/formylglycine-generating enzyme family protein, partial [Prosthecobacter sp.]|nr:bifunctional serine/threonine-protein kinase/formylglycine-generating enzyme family protein [Prosthecobacter sp.]